MNRNRLKINRVLKDAEAKNVVIGYTPKAILEQLYQDKSCFEAVTQPVLVHWYMWEGNIFVSKGHVSAIIDWERAIWGEALMDDRFRRHTRTNYFLKGYGQEQFSYEE